MKNLKKKKNKTKPSTEIELVFDEDTVTGVWYHPKLAPLLCDLCGKNCKEKMCLNTNPYCG